MIGSGKMRIFHAEAQRNQTEADFKSAKKRRLHFIYLAKKKVKHNLRFFADLKSASV